MLRTLNITCPCCDTILVVNKDTGEIIEERKPLVEKSSGDRFKDALQAQKNHSTKLSGLFSKSISNVSKNEKERQQLFEDSLKKARKEKIEKPLKDIELD